MHWDLRHMIFRLMSKWWRISRGCSTRRSESSTSESLPRSLGSQCQSVEILDRGARGSWEFTRAASCRECGADRSFMDLSPSILCWNVRGLNNPEKRDAVRAFVATLRVNVACLQETKMDVIDRYTVLQCLGPSFNGFAFLQAAETRG